MKISNAFKLAALCAAFGVSAAASAAAALTDAERQQLCRSLLKYCELDTLAMVMIWEHINYDLMQ